MLKPLTQALEALADPTRLRLVRLLLQGEACVCELVEALQLPQYSVSRHLRQLRAVGLVAARREGRWMHYRLADAVDRRGYRDLLKGLDSHLSSDPVCRTDDGRLARGRRHVRACPAA